jgi:hypothetical protein
MAGRTRAKRWLVLGVTLAACGALAATTSAAWKTPRTAWGHPDLQGVWTSDAEVSVPFERPRAFGDRALLTEAELADRAALEKKLAADDPDNRDTFRLGPVGDGPEHWFEWAKHPSARTSLVVDPPDGRIPPWTEAAQARVVDPRRIVGYGERPGTLGKGPFDGPEDLNLAERCITRGMPTIWFPQVYNNGFQIVQTPTHVVVFYERLHEARIIPVDGRPPLPAELGQWMGDSRGRFEGDTLVVEVGNFSDKTSFRRSGRTLRLAERYRRLDEGTVRVEITIDDPATWTRPWTVAVTGKADPAYSTILEYACHEGNYSLPNTLKGARARERTLERAGRTAPQP